MRSRPIAAAAVLAATLAAALAACTGGGGGGPPVTSMPPRPAPSPAPTPTPTPAPTPTPDPDRAMRGAITAAGIDRIPLNAIKVTNGQMRGMFAIMEYKGSRREPNTYSPPGNAGPRIAMMSAESHVIATSGHVRTRSARMRRFSFIWACGIRRGSWFR